VKVDKEPVLTVPVAAPGAGEDLAPPVLPTRHWRRWLETEHLALSLTLSYVFLAAVGMLHRGFVFLFFRINLLDYAEPSDFLLSALRDPLIVLVCIVPLPLVALYYRGASWLRRRFPDSFWATGGARGRRVQVELVTGTVRQPGDTLLPLLLGTTQKFVFLYDDVRQVTSVVPVDNVAQIRYDRRRQPPPAVPAAR
jgi:hypothetical protein